MNLREKIREVELLAFDFDGTLVDSNELKINAFSKCFPEYEDRLSEIMVYCGRAHHTPRFVKFRHVFENILKIPYTKAIEERTLARYAAETTEQVIRAREISGAMQFLQGVAKSKSLAVLSSTPHDVLLTILKRRHIETLFQKVKGAPVEKGDWLADLSETALFFGDTDEDWKSAQKANIPFVGVRNRALQKADYYIENFEELL